MTAGVGDGSRLLVYSCAQRRRRRGRECVCSAGTGEYSIVGTLFGRRDCSRQYQGDARSCEMLAWGFKLALGARATVMMFATGEITRLGA